MSILITICARGGSKGIPGKNIKPIHGIPLIGYTINTAKSFKEFFNDLDIALSTDSAEIKRVAESFDIYTSYNRPKILAGDEVGKIDVIKDILDFFEKQNKTKYDYVLDLDVTSPLRTIDDLKAAFKLIDSNPIAINIFSVSPAARSPYFNMVEIKANGFYAQVVKSSSMVFSRQKAPKVFDMNASFYFYKRAFFDLGYKGAITDKSLIYEVPHLCFDLDHPIDMEFLSFLLEKDKLGFSI